MHSYCNIHSTRNVDTRVKDEPRKVSQARMSLSKARISVVNFLQSISICSTLMPLHDVVFQDSKLLRIVSETHKTDL